MSAEPTTRNMCRNTVGSKPYPQLAYSATEAVHQVIAAMGRVEDAKFSPDLRRLALAGFDRNCIFVFDIDIRSEASGKLIALLRASELTSPELKGPHGLDFIDSDTLVVANRSGSVCMLKLPTTDGYLQAGRHPAQVLLAAESPLLRAPGSIAVCRTGLLGAEILVCNNSGNTITRHTLNRKTGYFIEGKVVLRKWLDIPDGISLSRSQQWIAISNHKMHCAMLYRNTSDLHPDADPQAILLGAYYPHGLRMTADERYILVADAGSPFVHIYARPHAGWAGLQYPCHSLRVMDPATFASGQLNPQEGGPKGIDMHPASGILAVSCASMPLAFFDLEQLVGHDHSPLLANDLLRPQPAARALAELDILQEMERLAQRAKAEAAETQLHAVLQSNSWLLMTPLRWIFSALKRVRPAANAQT